MMQLVVYNGHNRKHPIKFQTVTGTGGLILHAIDPVEWRRLCPTLWFRSELEQKFPEVLECGTVKYCLYGNSSYNRRRFLEVPYKGSYLKPYQPAFNRRNYEGGVTIEWILEEIKAIFTAVDFKHKMKVLESPFSSLYLATMHLENVRNCFYPQQTSKYFGYNPQSLEAYLSISKEQQ